MFKIEGPGGGAAPEENRCNWATVTGVARMAQVPGLGGSVAWLGQLSCLAGAAGVAGAAGAQAPSPSSFEIARAATMAETGCSDRVLGVGEGGAAAEVAA